MRAEEGVQGIYVDHTYIMKHHEGGGGGVRVLMRCFRRLLIKSLTCILFARYRKGVEKGAADKVCEGLCLALVYLRRTPLRVTRGCVIRGSVMKGCVMRVCLTCGGRHGDGE